MIVLPRNHEEWLQERKNGIGASDAGTIIGVNKWKTNLDLWREKVGLQQAEDISHKPYVQYGHDAEPHLRALFALDHPELKVTYESPYKMIFSDELPFIFATPDGELEELATGRQGGLEIKTTEIMNPRQWKEWDNRIPQQYYAQVCHQMLATGWEFVYVLAQIKWTDRNGNPRKDIREYHIERNEVLEDITLLRVEETTFWHNNILTKQEPALLLPSI
ncbi:MAG: lambda-exonuclease family protein [Faecousia sp.]